MVGAYAHDTLFGILCVVRDLQLGSGWLCGSAQIEMNEIWKAGELLLPPEGKGTSHCYQRQPWYPVAAPAPTDPTVSPSNTALLRTSRRTEHEDAIAALPWFRLYVFDRETYHRFRVTARRPNGAR